MTKTRRWPAYLVVLALAIGFELGLLFFDRISVNAMIVPDSVETWIVSLWSPVEKILGQIPFDVDPPSSENEKLACFLGGHAWLHVLFFIAILVVEFGLPRSDRPLLGFLVVTSLIFRLSLVPFPPILETDLHRYILDGAVLANGVSPFKYSPSEILESVPLSTRQSLPENEARELEVLHQVIRADPLLNAHFSRVNHKEIRTIYPPLTQMLFAVSYHIQPTSQEMWKLINGLIDFAVFLLIVLYLYLTGSNLNRCVIYGWAPVVLKEFSNTGHHDPIAVVMSLIAIWYIHRGHRMVGGAFIGLGILGKIYPAVFLVVFHRKLGIRGVVTTVMIVILGYSPFLVSGGFGRSFHGLSAFGNNWESNSSLFALCEKVVWRVTYGKDPEPIRSDDSTDPAAAVRSMPFGLTRAQFVRRTVRLFLGGILFLILLWRARHPQDSLEDLLRSSLIAVGSVVLFSPVALPWYFCWALPYAVVFPRSSFLYLIMSVNLYYVYFWIPPGGAFGYKPWIRAVEYVPFYALLIRDLWVERVRRIAPDEG